MSEEHEVVGCDHDGCTFVETQVCARTGSSTPCELARWSDDIEEEEEEGEDEDKEEEAEPIDQTTSDADQEAPISPHAPPDDLGFHVGQELGEEDLGVLLNGDMYGRVIGVLGDAMAGKTSLLITFYMMLAAGEMEGDGFSFAGSLTLPGFETRCRHTRIWMPGRAPSSMTARTLIGSDRGAGFLHLDIAQAGAERRARLLLSDLPGEWTRDLILQARHADRLGFTRRCDALLVVIDGEQLVGGDRWAVLEDQKLLIDRMAEHLGAAKPPLALVATRRDVIGEAHPPILDQLVDHAVGRGFNVSAFVVCTFARDEKTPSGTGVPDVLRFCIGEAGAVADPAPSKPGAARLFGWGPAMTGGGIA